MKILFFSGTHYADCSFPLIKSLSALGHDVVTLMLLTPDRCHKTVININEQPRAAGILQASAFQELSIFKNYINLENVYFVNHPMPLRSFKSLFLSLKVRKFIKEQRADVIFYDSPFQLWGLSQYFISGKWFYMVHDPIPHIGVDGFLYRFHRKCAMLRASKYILFNNTQTVDFCKKYNICKGDIYYNKLSVYDVYTQYSTHQSVHDTNEILFFGRIDKYKGIEYLCKAMVEVHKRFPKVHLTIAGRGNYAFDYKKYKDLPYINFINKFIEYDEMADLFTRAHIVVCPYIEATQSGVIMSAFAFKKPVIATNVGGLPEMVNDNITGKLVPPADPISLANAITSLLNDVNLYTSIINNIENEYYSGKKSWKAIAERYIDIING